MDMTSFAWLTDLRSQGRGPSRTPRSWRAQEGTQVHCWVLSAAWLLFGRITAWDRPLITICQKHPVSESHSQSRLLSLTGFYSVCFSFQVLLKTWRVQGPEYQLMVKWTGPEVILPTRRSSVKLAAVKLWTHHTQVKAAPLSLENDPTPKRPWEQWVCEHLKLLFKKGKYWD